MSDVMIQVKNKIDQEWPTLSPQTRAHLYEMVELLFKISHEILGKEPSKAKLKAFMSQVFSLLHLSVLKREEV